LKTNLINRIQEERNDPNDILPQENIYDALDGNDEFYTQFTKEMEYITYLHKPIAGKKVFINNNTII
jgi:hypothetical protein